MNPLHTLFNNLGIKRTETLRESIPDESLQKIVCDIARQEKKTENQILHEIVRIALERRTNNTIQRIQWDRLTPREKESIAYTCLGYTNQQIGAKLVLSPETIKTHIHNAQDKMNIHSKADLRVFFANWDFSDWDDTPQKQPGL